MFCTKTNLLFISNTSAKKNFDSDKSSIFWNLENSSKTPPFLLHDRVWGEWVQQLLWDVYKTWTGVHGPPHGPGPWTTPWTWSWTRSMDQVPWTTPNFQKGNRPCQFYMKIYRRSGYEKQRLLFIASILEGLSRKSVLFWDRGPMNGKTTNSVCDTEDLVHFYPQYFHSNTFKLQFDREDTHPPVNPCLIRLYRA